MSVNDTVSGCPSATGVPSAPRNVSPCAGITCWPASCDDVILVSPSFFTMTAYSARGAGNRCTRSNDPDVTVNAEPICTRVPPGGNGPLTETWSPSTLASGDDPWRIPILAAPDGMSNAKGVGGFTGTD